MPVIGLGCFPFAVARVVAAVEHADAAVDYIFQLVGSDMQTRLLATAIDPVFPICSVGDLGGLGGDE